MQGRQLSFCSREAFWVRDSPKVKSKVPKGGNDQPPATTRDKNTQKFAHSCRGTSWTPQETPSRRPSCLSQGWSWDALWVSLWRLLYCLLCTGHPSGGTLS